MQDLHRKCYRNGFVTWTHQPWPRIIRKGQRLERPSTRSLFPRGRRRDIIALQVGCCGEDHSEMYSFKLNVDRAYFLVMSKNAEVACGSALMCLHRYQPALCLSEQARHGYFLWIYVVHWIAGGVAS